MLRLREIPQERCLVGVDCILPGPQRGPLLTGRPFHLPATHVNTNLVVIVNLLLHVRRYTRRITMDFLEDQAITQDGQICAPGYCQYHRERA